MRVKCDNKKISSVSIPRGDYIILTSDPNFRDFCDPRNPTIMGIKIKISKKISRVNCKWTDQQKFRRIITSNSLKMTTQPRYYIPMDFVYSK